MARTRASRDIRCLLTFYSLAASLFFGFSYNKRQLCFLDGVSHSNDRKHYIARFSKLR